MSVLDPEMGEAVVHIAGTAYPLKYNNRAIKYLERQQRRGIVSILAGLAKDADSDGGGSDSSISFDLMTDVILAGMIHLNKKQINENWLDSRVRPYQMAELVAPALEALAGALRGPKEADSQGPEGRVKNPAPESTTSTLPIEVPA